MGGSGAAVSPLRMWGVASVFTEVPRVFPRALTPRPVGWSHRGGSEEQGLSATPLGSQRAELLQPPPPEDFAWDSGLGGVANENHTFVCSFVFYLRISWKVCILSANPSLPVTMDQASPGSRGASGSPPRAPLGKTAW